MNWNIYLYVSVYCASNNYIRYILLTKIALYKEQVNSVIYLCKYFSSAVKVNFTEDCKVFQRERRRAAFSTTLSLQFVRVLLEFLHDIFARYCLSQWFNYCILPFFRDKKWKIIDALNFAIITKCGSHTRIAIYIYMYICSSINSEMYIVTAYYRILPISV